MKITVHRGTKEIGGTCIELTTGSARLILDLGLPLVTATRDQFDATAALRKSTAELIADGTIPRVSGLFDEKSPPPDAILLSHAHLDHMGLIHFSRPQVPVYTTSGTSKMMLAGAIFAGRKGLDRMRHRTIKTGKTFTIGDTTITAYAVDHSTFGCVAFLIEAEGKRLLYTGDLRNHGRKPGMMKTLLKTLKSKQLDVLIVEGTHLGGEAETGIGEHDLEEQTVELTRTAPELVLATFSPQDLDRLVTLYRTAVRSGRTFVVDAYAAFILHLLHKEVKIPPPKTKHGIRVFFNAGFRRKKNQKLGSLFAADRIELAEVLAEPRKHLMAFRPSMVKLDFAGQLPQYVRVLYGYWKGYLKNPDWVELQKSVMEVGGDFIFAHASGHIHVRDLIEFVHAVNAKVVIPVHTFEPRLLAKQFENVRLLEDGQPWEVSE